MKPESESQSESQSPDRATILRRLLPYVEVSDTDCATPMSLLLAIGTRIEREENIQRVEASNSMPHCKQAAIDFYNGARRWLPVTGPHWDYWIGVLPPRLIKNNILLAGEEFAGNLAFAIYMRDGAQTGCGRDTYWCALLTPREVEKGDVRQTLPFATELPVFEDVPLTSGDIPVGHTPDE